MWRTTPNAVFHREGGIAPARNPLEGYRLPLVARINTLDNRHLLQMRASLCPNLGTIKFKKSKSKLRLQKDRKHICLEYSGLYVSYLQVNPWSHYLLSVHTDPWIKGRCNQKYLEWLSRIASTDIFAFSDGSSQGPGRSSTWRESLSKGTWDSTLWRSI